MILRMVLFCLSELLFFFLLQIYLGFFQVRYRKQQDILPTTFSNEFIALLYADDNTIYLSFEFSAAVIFKD